MRLGPFELILILCIALIVFGPSKLPALAKSMGQAVKEFKKGTKDLVDDIETAGDEKKPEPKAAETTVANDK